MGVRTRGVGEVLGLDAARQTRGLCAVLGLALAAPWCGPQAFGAFAGQQRVASGLTEPVFVTHAPGDRDRLFIAQRGGPIPIFNPDTGVLAPTPFLSIPSGVSVGEGGLLGMAFHPDYNTNGKFYTYTTHTNGGVNVFGATSPFSTHIREYTVSANPNIANATPTPIMSFPRPQDNHVGGWIDFSPDDGYLYIASGDGGGSNDSGTGHVAGGNAQSITGNLFGKMLRIDVNGDDFPLDAAKNYAVPPSNPFVGQAGDDEIWSYGLRNPFRASFDRVTADLWIGDVGQGAREEIDFQPAGDPGGANYGWRLREGTIATPSGGVGGDRPPGNVDPVYDYGRTGSLGGITVIGGYVYRGPDPSLQGQYVFGDAGSFGQPTTVKIWTFDPANPYGTVVNRNSVLTKDVGSGTRLASFGEDADGNLYAVYIQSGEVYRLGTNQFMPGDFNGAAHVDEKDLAIWSAGFGAASGALRTDGDANGDGAVDGADFLVWQRNLGWSPASAAASPVAGVLEPASGALVGVPLACAANWRRRGH